MNPYTINSDVKNHWSPDTKTLCFVLLVEIPGLNLFLWLPHVAQKKSASITALMFVLIFLAANSNATYDQSKAIVFKIISLL